MISVTSIPLLCRERIADSLPEPGPFTYTLTLRSPKSCASFAASSAATCAAYGVFFLEPLKPILPAEDQEITCPAVLVKEIITLLKVVYLQQCYYFFDQHSWTSYFLVFSR